MLINFGIIKDTTYYTIRDILMRDIVLSCSYTNNNYSVQCFGVYGGIQLMQNSPGQNKTSTKFKLQLSNITGRTDSQAYLNFTTWLTVG